jgi:hypothetical protein
MPAAASPPGGAEIGIGWFGVAGDAAGAVSSPAELAGVTGIAALLIAVLFDAVFLGAVLIAAEAELRVTTSGSQTDADHVRFYEKGRRCPCCLLRRIVGEQGDPVPAPSCSVLR